MKTLRIWLLLLLAVLLPVRGAIAAAMPCAGEAHPPSASLVQAHGHGHGQHHHMHDASATGEQALAHAHAGLHQHHHDDAGKCNLCASCCSAASMPATFSPSIAVLEEASASFPALHASAPTFLSDGQERPPRSI